MKPKFHLNQFLRFLIQILCFFLLPGLFAGAFYGIEVFIQGLLAGELATVWIALFPTVVLILVSTLIGRYFCGYMCAFGTLQDGMSFLGHNVFHLKSKMPEKVDAILKYLKYFVLAFLVISFFFTPDILGNFSPWSAFGAIFTIPTDFASAFSTMLPGTILLGVILLGALFFDRFFCRYLCPLGAIFSVVSRLRFGKIKKERSGCGACHICTNSCPMGIELYKVDVVKSGECINCMNCVNVCPRSNPVYPPFSKKTKLWAASVVAISFVGLYYVGNLGVNQLYADSFATSLGVTTTTYYKDGTYTGSGNGYRGTITLSVTISGGKITDITTVSESDNSQYDRAFSTVVSEIISTQSTDVSTVSGCTYSSNGIKSAVADALAKAVVTSTVSSSSSATSSAATTSSASSSSSSSSSSVKTSSSSSSSTVVTSGYVDGTYQGSGSGYRGTITLSVTISGGKITSISKVSVSGNDRLSQCYSTMVNRIISAQSSAVSTVSGCTYSSNGIKTAVAAALAQAAA